VTRGERHTLAMWFTRSLPHAEDAQLLRQFASQPSHALVVHPPPPSMFLNADGVDVRHVRLNQLGLCSVQVRCTQQPTLLV